MIDQVIHHAKAHEQQYLKDLFELLRIPSDSMSPQHKPDILKAANWLSRYMRQIGLEHVQLIKTSGNPIVYGDWLHSTGKPTVLIYGHYDVQPADPLDKWTSPPFEPTIRGNRLYGRGTSDSKCQHFIFLAAVSTYFKTLKKLPVNVKFVIEGEEETGSQNFLKTLKNHYQLFSHHLTLIVDLGMPTIDTPSIGYGLRGLLYTEITVTGPKTDLHSGVYGGAVDNPANVLINLLSKLKQNQKVSIPGFYDDVQEISQEEKNILRKYPRTRTKLMQDAGVDQFITEPGRALFEQRKTRPTLDINGIFSGHTGPGGKTIIPAKAHAKVSMRLVPNQNPDRIFNQLKHHLEQHTPSTVRLEIIKTANVPPLVTDYKSREIKAISQALKQAFKKNPVLNRSGATIGAAGDVLSVFKKPVALIGFSPPDDNMHAPNENFYLPNFGKGIEAAIRIFHSLSA